MKKFKSLLFLTVVLLTCCLTLFASCNKKEQSPQKETETTDPCAQGHTVVIDNSVLPTCTSDGLTEGRHCAICLQTLVAQEKIPKKDHDYEAVVTDPTVSQQGYTTYTCKNCPDYYIGDYVSATGSWGLAYEITGDGRTCTITGIGSWPEKKVYIPEKNEYGYRVTAIGESAFKDNNDITIVKIPDCVTSIEKSAFSGCEELITVTIGNGVTTIGQSAFSGCEKLTNVSFGSGITTIGDFAFDGCEKLTKIRLGENVATIGKSAFSGTALETLTLPKGIKTISDRMFDNCHNLVMVILPEGVTEIGELSFCWCTKLESIVIPTSLTNVDSDAFEGCGKLNKIYYTGTPEQWELIKIKSGSPKLKADNCYYYSEIQPTVTTYNYWYYVDGAPAVWKHIHTEVIDPAVAPTCKKTGLSEGKHCSSCGQILVRQMLVDVIDHNYAWTTLQDHKCYPNGVSQGTCSMCGIQIYKSLGKTEHDYQSVVTAPTKTEQGYTTHTCKNCPESYVDSYVSATGSIGLGYFTIGSNRDCTITGMGYCSDTEIVIPEYIDGHKVVGIEQEAFANNSIITAVIIPDTVTKIGNRSFSWCEKLSSVTIGNGVTSIGNSAFSGCQNLKNLTIGNNVSNIGWDAFMYCTGLTEVVLPNSLTNIGIQAFHSCINLTQITLPDNIKTLNHSMFVKCQKLTSITIPDSITSIEYQMFHSCSNLTSIIIPDSVKSIGDDAFAGCNSLDIVYYTGTAEEWRKISISSSYNEDLTTATIYYYSEVQPNTAGKYWRYVDGIPTAWE